MKYQIFIPMHASFNDDHIHMPPPLPTKRSVSASTRFIVCLPVSHISHLFLSGRLLYIVCCFFFTGDSPTRAFGMALVPGALGPKGMASCWRSSCCMACIIRMRWRMSKPVAGKAGGRGGTSLGWCVLADVAMPPPNAYGLRIYMYLIAPLASSPCPPSTSLLAAKMYIYIYLPSLPFPSTHFYSFLPFPSYVHGPRAKHISYARTQPEHAQPQGQAQALMLHGGRSLCCSFAIIVSMMVMHMDYYTYIRLQQPALQVQLYGSIVDCM